MSETTMPATEAAALGDDRSSYELAFHVLPTVAEGEVSGVFDGIKAHITKAGGEIFDEEVPQRFELAYEVVKHLEGRNRKFKSAYFGWVRFKAEGGTVATLLEEIEINQDILRHLLVKLTREEATQSFRFHEAMAEANIMVTNFGEVDADVADVVEEVVEDEAVATVLADDAVATEDVKEEVV